MVAIATTLLKSAYDLRNSLFILIPLVLSMIFFSMLFIKLWDWPGLMFIFNSYSYGFLPLLTLLFLSRAYAVRNDKPKLSKYFLLVGCFSAFLLLQMWFKFLFFLPEQVVSIINSAIWLGIIAILYKASGITHLKTEYNQDYRISKYMIFTLLISFFVWPVYFIVTSKPEVMEAFELVKTGLDDTIETMNRRRQGHYKQLERMEQSTEKSLVDKAQPVRHKTNEILQFIDSCKNEIVEEAGGRNKNGKLHNPKNLKAVGNIMIDKKLGYKLKDKIQAYRDEVLMLIEQDHIQSFKERMTLSIDYSSDKRPGTSWVEYNFKEIPPTAALTILTKFANDAISSELLFIEYLIKQNKKDTVRN